MKKILFLKILFLSLVILCVQQGFAKTTVTNNTRVTFNGVEYDEPGTYYIDSPGVINIISSTPQGIIRITNQRPKPSFLSLDWLTSLLSTKSF